MKIDNFPCDSLLFCLKFFTKAQNLFNINIARQRGPRKDGKIAIFDWRILKNKIFSWNFQFAHRRTSKEYFPLINLLCSSDSFVKIIDIAISSSHDVNRFIFWFHYLSTLQQWSGNMKSKDFFLLDEIFFMPRRWQWSENQRAGLDDEWEDWSIVWVLLNKFSSRCLPKCVGREMTIFFSFPFAAPLHFCAESTELLCVESNSNDNNVWVGFMLLS